MHFEKTHQLATYHFLVLFPNPISEVGYYRLAIAFWTKLTDDRMFIKKIVPYANY